jgi:pimeloyl-ACP methyl ester carboxylesterase
MITRYAAQLSLALLTALPLFTSAQATNIEREQRWVEQTIDSIFDGEPVFLPADGREFYAIYMDSETPGSKGLIVVHGTGFHPDWEQVVEPVRVTMTQHGWNTLSIQMPILEKDAHYEDYIDLYPLVPARFRAAINYLRSNGAEQIAIVAHSQGATMASYFVANEPDQSTVDALALIGMSAQYRQPQVNSAESLRRINIPVLDLYGSKDFATVLATTDRRAAASTHNKHYTQQIIPNAYHFFDDHEKEMLNALNIWLDQYID